ncbi:TPA: hypothetical protein DIC38_02645 [Candidatus Nomurabacteria bacterium]|nr:MAG: hypothetical protein O210_OD1C00001G0036 [Parcubacteria bacterium RAAC4_OD1_1]HCY26551.1 hypothetical protein [Candidatus Nomurabacteria bacterium]
MFYQNKKLKRKIFKNIKIGIFVFSFMFTSLFSYLPNLNTNEVKVAEAYVGTRVKTVEFFAGQYASSTLANAGVQNNFEVQNVEISETNVDIINSYIEFSAQVGANASTTITEGLLYFSACAGTSCTPATPAMVMNTAGLGTSTGESQTIRLRTNIATAGTDTDIFSTFTGGAFSFQVGYCIDGASGTDGSTCNGTVAASIQSANAKLVTTYTYDDTSTYQTNTVIYPLESNTTGPVGSKTIVQASCTMDSNCPKFSYNTNIPELSSQVSQFFHTQFFGGSVSTTTDHQFQAQVDGNTSGSTMYFEQALSDNGGAMDYLVSGLDGYENNTAQQLETRVNGNAYVLGGENYVTYKYPNSAGVKTKTIVLPVGEVQTVGSITKSSLVGPTVKFPETGVSIKKAWFRVHTSAGGQTTASNLNITTKVGSNTESLATAYSIGGTLEGVSDDGYFIHMIPSSDYSHLETANIDTGIPVQMSAQWSTPYGAVSGELVITYTYTGDTNGFNTTQRLFAGQSTTTASTTFSAPTGAVGGIVDPYIYQGIGNASILGVSLKMDGKDTSATANQTVGANMSVYPNACTSSDTFNSTTLTDTQITKVSLFKEITGVVTNNNTTTYTPCYNSSQATIFNGTVAITTMVDFREVVASGGTETTINVGGIDYKVHTFLSSGTFTVTSGGGIEYLVVGGGGGTENNNAAVGGGGAGGVLTGSTSTDAGSYSITVGSGGLGYFGGTPGQGQQGGSSSIGSLVVATGGGASNSLPNGGSGAGGTAYSSSYGPGGTGIAGQGYPGGAASATRRAGGGGGASQAGGNSGINNYGGDGGDGIQSSINGTATYYGGGGGGAGYTTNGQGDGGLGGGANGSYGAPTSNQNGTPNTGGGGGGSKLFSSTVRSGSGGSGIVIIRYPMSTEPSFSQLDYRFFENEDGNFVYSSLGSQNTNVSLSQSGEDFRLRMLLKIENYNMTVEKSHFKLQFSEKSGSCDTSFVGENYMDVSYDTDISFKDNFYSNDGVAFTSNALDPTVAGTIVNQSYVESNPSTNLSVINIGQYGMWDFSLYDKSVSNSSSYCLRVVKANNELLDTYSFIPEITTAVYRSRGGGIRHIANPLCMDGIDNDSDTYIDGNDSNCHINGVLSNSYITDWNSETVSPVIAEGGTVDGGEEVTLPACSDWIDNDSDTDIDNLDPGCHLDGNINNTYIPEHNSETVAPVSNTGGTSGDDSGDLGYLNNKLIFQFTSLKNLKNLLLAMVLRPF